MIEKKANLARLLAGMLTRAGGAVGSAMKSPGLVNYGVPLAAGGATGAIAHSQGATPYESTMLGLAGGSLVEPRLWRAAWANRAANPTEGPLGNIIKGIMPAIGRKAGFTGLAVAPRLIDSVTGTAANLKDTTQNVKNVTEEVARTTEGLGSKINKSVESQLGNYELGSKNFAQTLGNVAHLTSEDGLGGPLKDTAKALGGAAGQLGNAAGSIGDIGQSVKQTLPAITEAAKSTAQGVERLSKLPETMNKGIVDFKTWLTQPEVQQRLGYGAAGLAGAGALGMLYNSHKKRKENDERMEALKLLINR